MSTVFDEFLDFGIPSDITVSTTNTFDGLHYIDAVNGHTVAALLSGKPMPGGDLDPETVGGDPPSANNRRSGNAGRFANTNFILLIPILIEIRSVRAINRPPEFNGANQSGLSRKLFAVRRHPTSQFASVGWICRFFEVHGFNRCSAFCPHQDLTCSV